MTPPELRTELDRVVSVLEGGEATFEKTLERGLRYLDEELSKGDVSGEGSILLVRLFRLPC